MKYLMFLLLLVAVTAHAEVHHEMLLRLNPAAKEIAVSDKISFKQGRKSFVFTLHSALSPKLLSSNGTLTKLADISNEDISLEKFRIDFSTHTSEFSLEYRGMIDHPLKTGDGGESGRGITETPGLISPEGAVLFGSTYWYPIFDEENFLTFSLDARAPQGWTINSQGKRTLLENGEENRSVWVEKSPQTEIYLNAAAFSEYGTTVNGKDLMAFMRSPDEALANKYLAATEKYLKMYENLIGAYPYEKFALVENFWDTGFGMPSFTLIGSNVLRLPFIINSSYPHEILHNWWGNSVYVSSNSGNWCEGLTVYFADHLIQEQQGLDKEYRRSALEKYTSFVNEKNDFPLNKFVSRYDDASSAIGYGKAMMFFHMLRLQLGDKKFIQAMKNFYERQKFSYAAYADIQTALEEQFGGKLLKEFDQWVSRVGAPEFKIENVRVDQRGASYRLKATLKQVQKGLGFFAQLPVAIHVEGSEFAVQKVLDWQERMGRMMQVSIDLPARPYLFEVDPEFDVFRRLARDEVPSTLAQAYGSESSLIIVPYDVQLTDAYQEFADTVRKNQSGNAAVVYDKDIPELPKNKTVWILGRENKWAAEASRILLEYGLRMGTGEVTLGEKNFSFTNHAFAFTALQKENPNFALVFAGFDAPSMAPIFGSKLPHYGKYSYAVFESPKVTNIWRGEWSGMNSSMSVRIPSADGSLGKQPRAKLAPRSALATENN